MINNNYAQKAREAGFSRQAFYLVMARRNLTTQPDLAVAVAKHIGGRPIDFITKSIRGVILQVRPDLDTRYQKPKPQKKKKSK